MKKLLFTKVFIWSILIFAQIAAETKYQKIERLFELTNDKAAISDMCQPLFANANITDETSKKNAIDKYFEPIKSNFVLAYNKFFDDAEIDDLLTYNQSGTGKKFNTVSFKLNLEMQNCYGSIMHIIQDLIPKQEVEIKLSQSNVIHFDELAKGKSNDEIRDLFKKELNVDGLTVVKFSAVWCGPCKSYASDFEKVTQELKEIVLDGKKIAIKYIALDIDATPLIAQDNAVVSIPTTLFYKNGKKIDSQVGYLSPHVLGTKIKELANKE